MSDYNKDNAGTPPFKVTPTGKCDNACIIETESGRIVIQNKHVWQLIEDLMDYKLSSEFARGVAFGVERERQRLNKLIHAS